MKADLHLHYTTVGHVTIDVLPDGSRRPGGAAFYSALQAARLGLEALIVTRGVPAEVEELLEPYREELDLRVVPGDRTTTLLTSGSGAERSQRVLAWAGPLPDELELESSILHLAPIARETPSSWRGRCAFVGLTPQGLVRSWSGPDARMSLSAPDRSAADVADGCDAIVVSEHERGSCADLIALARDHGAIVAITDGDAPTTILMAPDDRPIALEVPELDDPRDDLGAGDVFAAAFFVALAEGRQPLQAAAFANAAAAVRIRGVGPGAVGSREAIEARLLAVGAPGA